MSDTEYPPEDEVKPVLTILYQDEYIVAVDKPAGLFVHRSFMDKDEKYFVLQLLRDQIGKYVYPLHRLDKPTSGVLLFALTKEVTKAMNEAFMNKKIQKTYFAITRGHLDGEALIDYSLKEKLDKIGDKYADKNKSAQDATTYYKAIKQGTVNVPVGRYPTVRYSLVKLLPHTGRRHQIRRHLAHLRHPIIGDINYGDNKQNPFFAKYFGFKRLMLLAQKIEFIHPVTHVEVIIETGFDKQWIEFFNVLGWSAESFLK